MIVNGKARRQGPIYQQRGGKGRCDRICYHVSVKRSLSVAWLTHFEFGRARLDGMEALTL